MRAPSEPVKNPSADVEEFARNAARIMEEGGKAPVSYTHLTLPTILRV